MHLLPYMCQFRMAIALHNTSHYLQISKAVEMQLHCSVLGA